mgnify:CR=1 FL=1
MYTILHIYVILYMRVNMPRRKVPRLTDRPSVESALKNTGQRLRNARLKRGWSQQQLGERMGGIDRRTISAMEDGQANISFGLVMSAMWILDIDLLSDLAAPPPNERASGDKSGARIGDSVRIMGSNSQSVPYKPIRTRRSSSKKRPEPSARVTSQAPEAFNNDF